MKIIVVFLLVYVDVRNLVKLLVFIGMEFVELLEYILKLGFVMFFKKEKCFFIMFLVYL